MNLETREFEVRSVNTEERTVTGIAVPYNTDTNVGSYVERIERGAFGKPEDVKLFWAHAEPIGRITKATDTEDGLEIEAVISKTSRGDEAYTLLKDGVVNRFSVGFEPLEHRLDGDVVVRTKARLREVSIVSFPAYEDAQVKEIRNEQDFAVRETDITEKEDINMSEEITNEVADLRASVADLEQRFAVLNTSNTTSTPEFRSAGDFMKALASGSSEARDFATTVEADVTRPGWVNETLRLVEVNRPLINAFSRGALPASGNSIEYPRIKSMDGSVERQANEGDLLSYMEVALETATAPVRTYGGYSSLSRQAIERSDLAYLETVFQYQALAYAARTEGAVVEALTSSTIPTHPSGLSGADATASDVITFFANAAASIDGNPDVAVVGPDVWTFLLGLTDTTGRPMFNISGPGVNNIGSVNLWNNGSINVGGINVAMSEHFGGTIMVADRNAVKTFESPGAPVRLQDEDILRLTKDFSLYGYMAVAVTNVAGIYKGGFTA